MELGGDTGFRPKKNRKIIQGYCWTQCNNHCFKPQPLDLTLEAPFLIPFPPFRLSIKDVIKNGNFSKLEKSIWILLWSFTKMASLLVVQREKEKSQIENFKNNCTVGGHIFWQIRSKLTLLFALLDAFSITKNR